MRAAFSRTASHTSVCEIPRASGCRFCAAVCDSHKDCPVEAMVVIPVQASSRLHALTDDVDKELTAARGQLEGALATLRTAGLKANGSLAVGSPTRCLLDGLREFPATEIALLHDGKQGWEDAKQFAERIRIELGMDIYEVASTPTYAAAA